MMILISSTAKKHMRMQDVEPRFLVNFGILEEVVRTDDRFGTIYLSQINLN